MVDPDSFNDVPIFSLLDADERRVLAQRVSTRNFAKGEDIFTAGDPGTYAYWVQYGKVDVSITDLADEVIVIDVAEAGGRPVRHVVTVSPGQPSHRRSCHRRHLRH
ncbi:MAG: hypothetical protein ACREO5_14410 [Candidatus Binatia bacterium]